MTFLETIKIKNGIPHNLDYHFRRMQKTSETFFSSGLKPEKEQLLIPQEFCTGIVKCRIIYDSEIREITYTPYRFKMVRSLRLIEDDLIDYSFKYTDRNALNELLLQKEDCDEILIVKQGMITDTSYSNVVFEKKQILYTPASFLLNGTKRQFLLENKIIRERPIYRKDISQFDRIYLINAMIDPEDDISLAVEDIR